MPDSMIEVHDRGGHGHYPRPRCPKCQTQQLPAVPHPSRVTPTSQYFVTGVQDAAPALTDLEQYALNSASWGGFVDREHFLSAGGRGDRFSRALALNSLQLRGLYYEPNASNPRLLRLTEAGRRLVGV